jgi:hypothetical protein
MNVIMDSGTITTFPDNEPFNISQISGSSTGMTGNGNAGAATLRVVLATDQTPLTSPLLVTLSGTNAVTTVGTSTPGTGATNAGKAIDSAVGATDTGFAALFQRFDSPTTLTPASGDYVIPRTDSLGRTWVNCATGCSGGTQFAEDVAAQSGDTGTLMLGVIQATLSAPAADGDYTVPKLTANGVMYTHSDTVDVAENAAVVNPPIPVGGVYRSSPVTLDTGDSGYILLDVNGRVQVSDGSGALNVICDSGCSGGAQYTHDAALTIGSSSVTLAGGRASAAVPTDVSADGDAVAAWMLRSGAMAIQPTFGGVLASVAAGTAATAQRVVIATDDPVNDFAVKGDANMVAHDAADAGNPLKIGFSATTSISAKTMVVNNDRTDAFAGIDGIQITRPHANLEDRVSTTPVAVTDGSSTSLVAAQGSGIRFCATTLTVSNSSATNVTVDLRDGTAGAVLWTVPAAANMGGAVVEFPVPLCTSANTALAVDPSTSASTIVTSIIGFKTKL